MIHFVVGTRAQLLKLAPVMVECRQRSLAWRWVYSAQHRETIEQLLATFELPPPDHVLVRWDDEARSMGSMGRWFAGMVLAEARPRRALAGRVGPRHLVVTHGDTFTTWFGALLGKLTRTPVLHVESGLRSFNLRKPFPEELNRLVTFRLADLYACQDEEAIANLRRYKGFKFNTHGNTQIDTLRFGLAHSDRVAVDVPDAPYAVVTLHRYENIFDRDRFTRIVDLLLHVAERADLVFIRHPATQLQLVKLGLLDRLEAHPRIHLRPRLEYLPFIKAVRGAEFVVTDGGGNQVELAYLGKPTLVFRDEVEQREGIGENAVVSRLDPAVVDDFLARYGELARPLALPDASPTKIIVDVIEERGFGRS
jgi:UDP-N-acetylglucosamine 2-epimerase (non-hydrolysing)